MEINRCGYLPDMDENVVLVVSGNIFSLIYNIITLEKLKTVYNIIIFEDKLLIPQFSIDNQSCSFSVSRLIYKLNNRSSSI